LAQGIRPQEAGSPAEPVGSLGQVRAAGHLRGNMYYAGLRPEEAISLGKDKGKQQWEEFPDSDGWGELEFKDASPDTGREWTADGDHRERRQLEHRADGRQPHGSDAPRASRAAPRPHRAIRLTRREAIHGSPGGELPTITYRRAWTGARKTALTPEEQKSPLARRIYDLRHACLSLWLNSGVAPAQVAEWAGHSVEVLLRIYAKCIDGQHEIAKRRIAEALRDDDSAAQAADTTRTALGDGGESRGQQQRLTWPRICHAQPHMDAGDRTQPHRPEQAKAPLNDASPQVRGA